MKQQSRVCAVVVTHNRKALLRECLAGLQKQTRPLDTIFVIDNASSDGTHEMLSHEFSDVEVLRFTENLGGAGGFYEGIKHGYGEGYDWIWVMDDDAEPEPDTLAKLLAVGEVVGEGAAVCPVIKGARDNRVQAYHHKRLDFWLRDKGMDPVELTTEGAALPIDGNAFVGPMFHREGIRRLGLPRKEYFLWVDDLEYTYRFSQAGGCYLVKDAVIQHKDKPGPISPIKLFYGLRNYTHFVARCVPKYTKAQNRKMLGLRIAGGLVVLAWLASRRTVGFMVRKVLRNQPEEAGGGVCPFRGFWDGFTGRLDKVNV